MQLNLKISVTQEEIKTEVNQLTEQIRQREAEIVILTTAIKHYHKQCRHQRHAANSGVFDGWKTTCPDCGCSFT